jgi:hypothetical protein
VIISNIRTRIFINDNIKRMTKLTISTTLITNYFFKLPEIVNFCILNLGQKGGTTDSRELYLNPAWDRGICRPYGVCPVVGIPHPASIRLPSAG